MKDIFEYILNLLYVLAPTISLLSIVYFFKKEHEKNEK